MAARYSRLHGVTRATHFSVSVDPERPDRLPLFCTEWCLCVPAVRRQILDPLSSPSLLSLSAVDVVRRFNECLQYNAPSKQVTLECELLIAIAKTVISKYPRAPTTEQRSTLVTFAAMLNMDVVRDVVNTLSAQITSAATVSKLKRSTLGMNTHSIHHTVSPPLSVSLPVPVSESVWSLSVFVGHCLFLSAFKLLCYGLCLSLTFPG